MQPQTNPLNEKSTDPINLYEPFTVDNTHTINNNQIIPRSNNRSNLQFENNENQTLNIIKRNLIKFYENENIQSIICPFSDSGEICQKIYKFCALATCILLLFMIYLIIIFK